jgi:hypothetical protein
MITLRSVAKSFRPMSRYGISLESGVPYEIGSLHLRGPSKTHISIENHSGILLSFSGLGRRTQFAIADKRRNRRRAWVAKSFRPQPDKDRQEDRQRRHEFQATTDSLIGAKEKQL